MKFTFRFCCFPLFLFSRILNATQAFAAWTAAIDGHRNVYKHEYNCATNTMDTHNICIIIVIIFKYTFV